MEGLRRHFDLLERFWDLVHKDHDGLVTDPYRQSSKMLLMLCASMTWRRLQRRVMTFFISLTGSGLGPVVGTQESCTSDVSPEDPVPEETQTHRTPTTQGDMAERGGGCRRGSAGERGSGTWTRG